MHFQWDSDDRWSQHMWSGRGLCWNCVTLHQQDWSFCAVWLTGWIILHTILLPVLVFSASWGHCSACLPPLQPPFVSCPLYRVQLQAQHVGIVSVFPSQPQQLRGLLLPHLISLENKKKKKTEYGASEISEISEISPNNFTSSKWSAHKIVNFLKKDSTNFLNFLWIFKVTHKFKVNQGCQMFSPHLHSPHEFEVSSS